MYKTEQELNNTKKYRRYIVGIVLAIAAVVLLLGRVEFHNELERAVLPHSFLGYLDEAQYTGSINITDTQWPKWAEDYEKPAQQTVDFKEHVEGGRIGIFADLVYYENRYELRTWFSGRLLECDSIYYYRPEGALYLEAVYEPNRDIDVYPNFLVPNSN